MKPFQSTFNKLNSTVIIINRHPIFCDDDGDVQVFCYLPYHASKGFRAVFIAHLRTLGRFGQGYGAIWPDNVSRIVLQGEKVILF